MVIPHSQRPVDVATSTGPPSPCNPGILQIIDVYDVLQRTVYGLLDGHSVEHAIATGAGTLQQVQ